MRAADDRLSRCTSALLALAEREDGAYDDVSRFGAPSECIGEVRRATELAALRVLDQYGYTTEGIAEAIVARTTDRFVCLEIGAVVLGVLPNHSEAAR